MGDKIIVIAMKTNLKSYRPGACILIIINLAEKILLWLLLVDSNLGDHFINSIVNVLEFKRRPTLSCYI